MDSGEPAAPDEDMGWITKAIAVPLAPVVLAWDGAKAFFTRALPAAPRKTWSAITTPFRALWFALVASMRVLVARLDAFRLVLRG